MTAVAIDLGLTKVKLALARPALKSSKGTEGCIAIPSCVYVSQTGEILSGELAAVAIARDPAGAVRDVTTKFHRMESFPSNGHLVNRQSLLVHLLGDLRKQCELSTGLTGPWECYMTVPAALDTYRKERLAEVAHQAGFALMGLIENPIAVSQYWLREGGSVAGTLAAICDIGGVTTELSLVQYRDGRFSLASRLPPMQLHIGGGEVEEALWEMLIGASTVQVTAADAPELRRQLAQAKEALAEGKLMAMAIATGEIALAVTTEMVRKCSRTLATRLRDELDRFHQALGDGVSGPLPLVVAGGGSLLPGLIDGIRLGWSRGPIYHLPQAGFASVLGAIDGKSDSPNTVGEATKNANSTVADRPKVKGNPFDNFNI